MADQDQRNPQTQAARCDCGHGVHSLQREWRPFSTTQFETEKRPNHYGRKTVETTFGIYSERPIRQFLKSPSRCRFTQRYELGGQILGQHICDDLIDGLAAATWGPFIQALCHQRSASGARRSPTHAVITKAIPNKKARLVRLGITSILPLLHRPHAISTSSFSSGNLPAHGKCPRVNSSCSSAVSATALAAVGCRQCEVDAKVRLPVTGVTRKSLNAAASKASCHGRRLRHAKLPFDILRQAWPLDR
jgi:hypothetical protein